MQKYVLTLKDSAGKDCKVDIYIDGTVQLAHNVLTVGNASMDFRPAKITVVSLELT